MLVVKLPSNTPELLRGLFYNQIRSLNAIHEMDESEENKQGQVSCSQTFQIHLKSSKCQNVSVRDWIRNAAGDENTVKDHIIIHMLPKYGVSLCLQLSCILKCSQNPNKGHSNKRLTKRTLSDFNSDSDIAPNSSPRASVIPTRMLTPLTPHFLTLLQFPRLNKGRFTTHV